MKQYYLLSLFILTAITFTSCKEEQEDITHEINKDGSVETSVTVEHLDNKNDLLVTKHIVWNHNAEYKTIYARDTIPALGIEHTVAENSDEETKPVSVKKDYEIFITVK
jgi:hypothetical protein